MQSDYTANVVSAYNLTGITTTLNRDRACVCTDNAARAKCESDVVYSDATLTYIVIIRISILKSTFRISSLQRSDIACVDASSHRDACI